MYCILNASRGPWCALTRTVRTALSGSLYLSRDPRRRGQLILLAHVKTGYLTTMLRLALLAPLFPFFLSGALCQEDSSTSDLDALSVYPACAVSFRPTLADSSPSRLTRHQQQCIGSAFLGGLCAPTDQLCICNDGNFQMNVTTCVALSCSIPDSLSKRSPCSRRVLIWTGLTSSSDKERQLDEL